MYVWTTHSLYIDWLIDYSKWSCWYLNLSFEETKDNLLASSILSCKRFTISNYRTLARVGFLKKLVKFFSSFYYYSFISASKCEMFRYQCHLTNKLYFVKRHQGNAILKSCLFSLIRWSSRKLVAVSTVTFVWFMFWMRVPKPVFIWLTIQVST